MACQRSTPVSDGPGAQVAPADPSTSTWCFSGRTARNVATSLPSATHRPLFLLFSHRLNFFLGLPTRRVFQVSIPAERIQRPGGELERVKVTTMILWSSTHRVPVVFCFLFLLIVLPNLGIWFHEDVKNLLLPVKNFLLLINHRNMTGHPNQPVGAEVCGITGTDAATNLTLNHNYFHIIIFFLSSYLNPSSYSNSRHVL